MKAYYYLLFRIYNQLIDPRKKYSPLTIIILLINTSTLLIWLFLYTVVSYIDYYFLSVSDSLIPNKWFILLYILIIGVCNYLFLIKGKKFLEKGFKIDQQGGYAIIVFLLLIAISFLFVANKNREKIFKEKERLEIENSK